MKTKTLVCVLNVIDNCIGILVDENSTEEQIKKNLSKYNYLSDTFLIVLLAHWKSCNLTYNWNIVASQTNFNMQQLLEDTIQELKRTRTPYERWSNRDAWQFFRD